MALGECAEGLIRLFFVFLAFCLDHIGWALTFLIILFILFWIFGKFGLGAVQSILILLVIFFLFFFAAAWYTGAPLCQFADELSQWLV